MLFNVNQDIGIVWKKNWIESMIHNSDTLDIYYIVPGLILLLQAKYQFEIIIFV